MMYDYFYGKEGEQYAFYRIPKALFTMDCFANMTTDAKILYGLLLDRVSLSVENSWMDADGKVYIIFTLEEVMKALNCADKKATKLLRELYEYGLLERKRQGMGKPSIIYVKNFYSDSLKERFKNRKNDDSRVVQTTIHESSKVRGINTDISDIKDPNGKKYGKIVRSYHIYTRVVDNNTPIDRQADINDVEFLWRKRFGIELPIMERLHILLSETDKWVFDWGNKKYCYHSDYPEFQIIQSEDMKQGWVPAAAFYIHPVFHLARLNITYHNTIIYETALWAFDQFRKFLPEAQNSTIAQQMNFWYSYYLLDSIEGKLLKIFTHGTYDISSREPNYNQLLIFENADKKKDFDKFIATHFNDHSDDNIKLRYQYQIKEDSNSNLGGLIHSSFQVAKIAWLYEDWKKQ